MKLLADENFPYDSIDYLELRGFDIVSIGKLYQGISDERVIEIAIREQRVILTFDRDYGELIFKNQYYPPMGVIYLRLDQYDGSEPGRIIEKLILDHTFQPHRKLTVILNDSIRQRNY